MRVEAIYKKKDDNRAFVVKCGPIQPFLNFPQAQQGQRKYRFQKKKNGIKNSGAYLGEGGIVQWSPHFGSAF